MLGSNRFRRDENDWQKKKSKHWKKSKKYYTKKVSIQVQQIQRETPSLTEVSLL
jgi:hypothetical protein